MKLLIVIALFATQPLFGSSNYVDCTFPAITNALATYTNNGDIICIAPGECTLSNAIGWSKGITFRGSGMTGANRTTLRSADGLTSAIIIQQMSANSTFTISDFNLVGAAANSQGFINVGFGAENASPWVGKQFHIHHVNMTNIMSRGITVGYSDSFGLIDHCNFEFAPIGGATSPQAISFGGNGFRSWQTAVPYGTTNAVVVEDCTFKNAYYSLPGIRGGNGFWDGYAGMQAVIRHCVFDGPANNGTHGYDSQTVSQRSTEIYNCIFTNQTAASGLEWELIRGGGCIAFSNSIYMADTAAGGGSPLWLTYYRAACLDAYPVNIFGFAGSDITLSFTNINGTNWQITTKFYDGLRNTVTSTNPMANSTFQMGAWYPLYIRTNLAGADYVLQGATLAETLTNISLAINGLGATPLTGTIASGQPGYGTAYAAGTHKNYDFKCVGVTTNSITFRNRMDGTNDYGYPAAMQPGVIKMIGGTNSGVEAFPCYSWSNTVYGSNGVVLGTSKFSLAYSQAAGWCTDTHNYSTNLLVEGRDYFNDTIPDAGTYTPLSYPHPLQANENGGEEEIPPPSEQGGATVINVGTLRIGG